MSRNGCPPMVSLGGWPLRVADFGTGTSMVRIAGLSTVFGCRRCTLTCRESGRSTGRGSGLPVPAAPATGVEIVQHVTWIVMYFAQNCLES